MNIDRARELRKQSTNAERKLWSHLRARRFKEFKIRRQVPIAGYFADFVCHSARLIIELDGGQHADQSQKDAVRSVALARAGYRVIRFWNNELTGNMEDVLDRIQAALIAANHPSPDRSHAARSNGRPLPQGER